MSIYICPFVYLMHINTQVRARTHTRTSWVPLWTLIPKPSDCQLHLPLLMLFQPSRLIQGHEHQGSLFLWCARVCVGVFRHAYVCLSVHLCVCARLHVNVLTAHKSVSSLRHRDPEHALLPVSLWLASSLERAEDSSNNAPLSLRNRLIYILQFSTKEPGHSQLQYSHIDAGRYLSAVWMLRHALKTPIVMSPYAASLISMSHLAVNLFWSHRFKDMATFLL